MIRGRRRTPPPPALDPVMAFDKPEKRNQEWFEWVQFSQFSLRFSELCQVFPEPTNIFHHNPKSVACEVLLMTTTFWVALRKSACLVSINLPKSHNPSGNKRSKLHSNADVTSSMRKCFFLCVCTLWNLKCTYARNPWPCLPYFSLHWACAELNFVYQASKDNL